MNKQIVAHDITSYYSVIKELIKTCEKLNRKCVLLSERSQSKKATYGIVSFMTSERKGEIIERISGCQGC